MTNTPRTLFIHVGPPKTGTSAVQHFLRGHDNTTVVYPKVGLWSDGAHHNLVFNFYEDFRRPEVIRESTDVAFAAIREEAIASTGHIVISSEALTGRDIGLFIRELLAALGDLVQNTEIILACREHFSLASSLYNQNVKDFVHIERQPPGIFLRMRAKGLCYAPMIKTLRETGFPVRIINYHPAEDFVPRFLHSVGFTTSDVINSEVRNLSLSVKGMISTLAANNVAKSGEDRARSFAALRKMKKFFAASRFIFDKDAVAAVDAIFAEDRRYLSEELGVQLPTLSEEERKNTFFLSAEDLEDITAVTQELGDGGAAIRAFSEKYLRA